MRLSWWYFFFLAIQQKKEEEEEEEESRTYKRQHSRYQKRYHRALSAVKGKLGSAESLDNPSILFIDPLGMHFFIHTTIRL
jgi:hypothetical protein